MIESVTSGFHLHLDEESLRTEEGVLSDVVMEGTTEGTAENEVNNRARVHLLTGIFAHA